MTNTGLTNTNLTNPDLTNQDLTNPDLTNPGLTNPGLANPDFKHQKRCNSLNFIEFMVIYKIYVELCEFWCFNGWKQSPAPGLEIINIPLGISWVFEVTCHAKVQIPPKITAWTDFNVKC